MEKQSAPCVPAHNTSCCNFCLGYCCYRLPGATLYLDALDINRLARHFGISDGEFRRRYMENKNTFQTREDGSCPFLATDRMYRRCSVHEVRPRQCRDFPYGKPCPYLADSVLLQRIQPRIERSVSGENGERY